METTQAQRTWSISAEHLMALAGKLIDGDSEVGTGEREPQRWDHLVRVVLDSVSGPSAEAWFGSHAGAISHGGVIERVALNPQPLPPRVSFLKRLAQELVSRAELLEEVASAAEQRGIIIVGGYVSRFVDEFCGNGYRLPWLHPGPPPHWFRGELDGVDLLVLGSQFARAAQHAFSGELRRSLAGGAAKFAEASLAKMQP